VPLAKAFTSAVAAVAFPVAAFFATACGSAEPASRDDGHGAVAPSAAAESVSNQVSGAQRADAERAAAYQGPTVGAAKSFAALAYSAISGSNGATVTGNLGVSGASVSSITGFDDVPAMKFGTDSAPPHSARTILTQSHVDALVDDIDVRPCTVEYTNLAPGAGNGITLHPGVTCVNGSTADLLVSGRITLDAGGDPNAFFIIRSDFTLTVADDTVLVLSNGAQACSVFWRVSQQAALGAHVKFFGTLVAGGGISMGSGSTLLGRALSQTAAVLLDGNTITLPVYEALGSARSCTHLQ
jgi:ice-binding like protein